MSVPAQAPGQATASKGLPGGRRGGQEGADLQESSTGKFRDVLSGMNERKTAANGKLATAIGQGHDKGAGLLPGQTAVGDKTEAPDTPARYATENLTNAIRSASKTVFAKQPDQKASDQEFGLSDGAVQTGTGARQNESPQGLAFPPNTASTGSSAGVLTGGMQSNGAAVGAGSSKQALWSASGSSPAGPGGLSDGPDAKTGTSSLFAQFGIEPEQVEDPLNSGGNRKQALLGDAAETLKVVRQETHFAPTLRLSPSQQVGEKITVALKDIPRDLNTGQNGLTAKAEGPVLKTLDIQLTPHELGTVKVSLRMVGDTVDVTLTTSTSQAAELLKSDRQMLDQMLRLTGFKADNITVQTADDRAVPVASTSASSSSSNTGQGQTSGQSQPGGNSDSFFGGQGSGDQGQPSDNRNGERSRNTASLSGAGSDFSKGDGHEDRADIRLSDGIYL